MHLREAEMELRASEWELRSHEMALRAAEMAHIDMERLAPVAEIAAARALTNIELDMPRIEAAAEVAAARLAEVTTHFEPMIAPTPMGFAPSQDRFEHARPRAAWSQGEPADSLYRLAREALNRGEYRRAAQLFNEVTTKFKTSEYAAHSAYWEAFARYRLGTTEELRTALAILDAKNEVTVQLQSMRRESNIDVPALRARIQGALAARGDEAAARALRSEANQANGCDREEVSVRAEALSALGQMDVNAAMPAVRKVLANRDECTVELRRRALYLLGRENVEGRTAIFLDVAKNDSDAGIRGEAMSWLARTADANAVPMLQELLRTTDDERTQRSAVSALGSIDNDAARRAIRTIIEREDAAERVRYEAILTVTRKRGEDRLPSADDLTYLRQLYPKLTSTRLRQAVLSALARVETAENKQFFQSVVRNTNESSSVRASAMQRLGGMLTLEELTRMYDVADARSLREQILYALYERKEPESVDKMIDIARKDTDPQIRRHAITLLARRKDPRAQQLLQELIDK
jgi:HEAT repeat protein